MFYLGIDQHARQLTINLRDANGDVLFRKQVSTKPAKITQFFEELTARGADAGCGFWAIVEVCGFNDWLIEMLRTFAVSESFWFSPKTRVSGRPIAAMPLN